MKDFAYKPKARIKENAAHFVGAALLGGFLLGASMLIILTL